MRWPWRRRPPVATDEAHEACEYASRALKDAQNLAGRVDRVSDDLTETLRRNNFGPAIAAAMRGSVKP